MDISNLDAALSYAARGWPVFPQNGKIPMISAVMGGRGVHDATTDERQIREWWRRWPNANIGLACGVAGWWALDIDHSNGGHKTMRALTACHGQLPPTVTSRTGGGGWHMLFKLPTGVDLRNWSGGQCDAWPHLGVDIRARGVPITAPPSVHESRRRYRWVDGRGVDDIDIADTPEWLVKLVTPPPLPEPVAPRDPIDDGWGPKPRYSRAALDDACEHIRMAVDGCQEAILNAEAFGMGRLVSAGLMPEITARAALIRSGLLMENYDPRRPWTERIVTGKVDRALQAGKRRPNAMALEGSHENVKRIRNY